MKIALDFDGTYTLSPKFWSTFVDMAIMQGHDIRIVTMRNPGQTPDTGFSEKILPVIYTSRKQKREHCDEIGWHPDIWIDDSPELIVRIDNMLLVKPIKDGTS